MLCHKLTLKLSTVLVLLLFWITVPVAAAPPQAGQKQAENNFIYIVQPGDALIDIAFRYNLTLTQIVLANNLTNPNLIFPGQQIILPGISPPATPTPELLPSMTNQTHIVQANETLFSIASHYGLSTGAIILANNLPNPDVIHVGQILQIPPGPPPTPESLPHPFVAVELSEPTIIQGRTLVVKVTLSEPETVTLTGNFEGRPLFFGRTNDYFWTIIAIHALAQPNIYPITFTATLADGTTVTTFENVTVVEGPYGLENIQFDDSRGELLDAELIRLEQEKLTNLWSQISSRPRWTGPFWYPVERRSLRITSNFGTRRSYNDSSEVSFHGGTDFGGGIGVPIYAPAAGTVVLAEMLTVRGKAVLIDHGLGLFSGYWHLSRLAVTEGEEVQPGHLIGYMGDTGLVTGPHLHWEIRLTGIAVDPLQWVQQSIP